MCKRSEIFKIFEIFENNINKFFKTLLYAHCLVEATNF